MYANESVWKTYFTVTKKIYTLHTTSVERTNNKPASLTEWPQGSNRGLMGPSACIGSP